MVFSDSLREKASREDSQIMWRVLLETVLATGIFFGLYGAADAVSFAFRVVFSFFCSFFSRTQQKRAFMFGILLKHFCLDTCSLSLYVNSLSLSLSLSR